MATALAANAPLSPTVIDRALRELADKDPLARAEQIARDLDKASDPVAAARLTYELGELYERWLDDEDRAVDAYRRAFELDASLRPNVRALRRVLYRRRSWPELVKVIEVELDHATEDRERVDLWFEQAIVSGHQGSDDQARRSLLAAVHLAPQHQGALFELERVVARAGDSVALLDVYEHLAGAIDQPERRIGYWLDVARGSAGQDDERAYRALAAAAELGARPRQGSVLQPFAERVARMRFQIAEEHGTPAHLVFAIEALQQVIIAGVAHQVGEPPDRAITRRRELVALRRRQAQIVRAETPDRSWNYLQQALALSPDEPVVIVDLIEIAHELGRHDDLPQLVQMWEAVEDPARRVPMLSWWCAEAHVADQRTQMRALLRSVAETAPGFILLTSAAECDELREPWLVRAQRDLANTYVAGARSAALGSWLGPRGSPRPDSNAAAALYVQAAHLLAHYVGTPVALDQAREALGKALEATPDHPAVLEALIELDDATGHVAEALARLDEMAIAAGGDRSIVERAIRLTYKHGLVQTRLELERKLLAREPNDYSLAWQVESTMSQLGCDVERAELLGKLATEDVDPARRRTAMLRAARLHERAGTFAAATDFYRRLLTSWPADRLTRDRLIDVLRRQQRWPDLVNERRNEARDESDGPHVRRALREAAWVLEIWLDDVAQAGTVYEAWLARLPDDRTALEGLARCRATLGDASGEVTTRNRIAELDATPNAQWLYARSLERAEEYGQAAEQYRQLMRGEDALLAATSAIALGDLAVRGADITMGVEAADTLAKLTTDPQLGSSLFEDSGWMNAIALDDFEHATRSFGAALAVKPARQGALLGDALVAARQAEPVRLGNACVALASSVQIPEAAVALYLRAAVMASASGDVKLANERVGAARSVAPDHLDALFIAAEMGPLPAIETADPFAAIDRLLARAAVLEIRGALAADPAADSASRTSWDLDRAEALELAGEPSKAVTILAAVLQVSPDDWRALSAVRRIALRAGLDLPRAEASYALARLSQDPESKLLLLRDAAQVYDGASPSKNNDYAIAIYRQIVAIDPSSAEVQRLLQMLRERGHARWLIEAISDQLRWLAVSPSSEDHVVALLMERAALLQDLGHRDKAIIDLDAVLDYAPNHVEALRLRAGIAIDLGDVDGAVALWRRYIAAEPDLSKRTEIQQQLDKALQLDDEASPSPPTKRNLPDVEEQTTGVLVEEITAEVWDSEPTDADSLTALAALRTGSMLIVDPRAAKPNQRRDSPITSGPGPSHAGRPRSDLAPRVSPALDPFASTTVRVDISELQEQERQAVRSGVGSPTPWVSKPATRPVRATTDRLPGEGTHSTTIAELVGAFDPTPTAVPNPERQPPALDVAELFLATPTAGPGVVAMEPSLHVEAIQFPEPRPMSPDDSDVVMLSYEQLQPVKAASAELLLQYEREIAFLDRAALRLEAGRLSETLDDTNRARAHYEAALLANPRATQAMRGLRRIARASGDLVEVTRLVDAEIMISSPRERDCLSRHRIDLLLASGEQDLARVAVGELLDKAPLDIPALLTHLELAFLDDRTDEFSNALELLARAMTDPGLRSALQSARAVLAAHQGDASLAATWLQAAAESDPSSLATRLGAIRHLAITGHGEPAGAALFDLACEVEGEDPISAAALAMRAQFWATYESPHEGRETVAAAAQLAARVAPRDPLVARTTTETALGVGDRTIASHAFARWARCKAVPVERAYAAASAAELEPLRLGRLWAQVLELDPGDDYAIARLRAAPVGSAEFRLAIEIDLQDANDTAREAPLLRAAEALIELGDIDAAIRALIDGRQRSPLSITLAEELAEALRKAGRWSDSAKVLGELASPTPASHQDASVVAYDLLRLSAARAWETAARRTAAGSEVSREDVTRANITALEAWELVLADDPKAIVAHAATIALASQLDDPDIVMDVLARAQAAERSPWVASSFALRRAQLLLGNDPRLAHEVAQDAGLQIDDPRRTLVMMLAAAHRRDLGEAVTALEERAALLLSSGSAGNEPAALRLRAAQLALDADDAPRAMVLLGHVDQAVPGVADDLITIARRRTGHASIGEPPTTAGSFVRLLREADAAAARCEHASALALFQRALQIRPGDELAAGRVIAIAFKVREAGPIMALARDQLLAAESMGDPAAKVNALLLLARVDQELRGDWSSAQVSLENAARADPHRIDLMHHLERHLAVESRYGELLELRQRQVAEIKRGSHEHGLAEPVRDLAAMLMDSATLAVREKRPDVELADLYRAVIDLDPGNRLALFHLESILRRTGCSEDLASLEQRLAEQTDDARDKAALLTSAGQTLAKLGKPADAVLRFKRALEHVPSYVSAFEAWHRTALEGELWLELAEVVTRKATLVDDPNARAALHHVAGVALMDKAAEATLAIAAFRRVLELDPLHLDAFVRLRLLLEGRADREELATALRRRLDVETEPAAHIELHRMLAQLYSDGSERKLAMQHYRAILAVNPTDVRAHAAIADLASEHAPWQAQADAVTARIHLESDPKILHRLHDRLGSIYAEHDVAAALSAFERALACKPGDEDSLIRLADFAITASAWDVALAACDQLVTTQRDPEKLAMHLLRAARIFARGFADPARAERMLHLALDSAPTHTEALHTLVQFYKAAGDTVQLRVHIDRIVDAMRARVAQHPNDGAAYRMLSRAITTRDEMTGDGSRVIARAAAELAHLLGAAGEPEQRLIAEPSPVQHSLLAGPRAESLLFAHAVEPGLRRVLRMFANPITKHIGTDLAGYGVSRKDRLHPTDPIAATAREVAVSIGLKEIDVYVSNDPYVMVAEPTNPVSLVIGRAIASGTPVGIKFAAGGALKLAQMSLAIPSRLPPTELGVLGLALLRLYKADATSTGVNQEEVAAVMPKLRRLIPPALFDEVRPFALSTDTFSSLGIAQDLKIASLRAGLAASGKLLPGLTILAASVGTDLLALLADPISQGLIGFALSDDRAIVGGDRKP